jgi:hypothetical protein
MRGKDNKQKNYDVGYSIDELTNSFCIELYNDKIRMESVHLLALLKRVKEMNDNQGSYSFIKRCSGCERYSNSSNSFKLDYHNHSIGDLSVVNEYFGLTKPQEDGYKIYKLFNNYDRHESTIIFGLSQQENMAQNSRFIENPENLIKLPIINFVSAMETANRINTLIVFS